MARPSNADWLRLTWAADADPGHVNRRRGRFASRAWRDLMDAIDGGDFDGASIWDHDLPGGVTSRVSRAYRDDYDPMVHASGRLLGPDGSPIGKWDRTIMRRADGSLVAIHAEMDVDGDWQGKGIGTAFNAAAERRYAAAGVADVALLANKGVGGYTWGVDGYDWDPDATWVAMPGGIDESVRAELGASRESGAGDVPFLLDDLVATLERQGGMRYGMEDESDVAALIAEARLMRRGIDEGYVTPRMVAELGRSHVWTERFGPRDIPMWPGKHLLLGSTWSGIRPVRVEGAMEGKAWDPNQPRVPKGKPGGGRFLSVLGDLADAAGRKPSQDEVWDAVDLWNGQHRFHQGRFFSQMPSAPIKEAAQRILDGREAPPKPGPRSDRYRVMDWANWEAARNLLDHLPHARRTEGETYRGTPYHEARFDAEFAVGRAIEYPLIAVTPDESLAVGYSTGFVDKVDDSRGVIIVFEPGIPYTDATARASEKEGITGGRFEVASIEWRMTLNGNEYPEVRLRYVGPQVVDPSAKVGA